MALVRERLELCVTYASDNIELGIQPESVEFIEPLDAAGSRATTPNGHVWLPVGTSFYLSVDEFGIGRSLNNALCINSQSVSRSHAKIVTCTDQSFELHDTGGANGTFLNGHKLESHESCKLQQSGEIQLAGIFHIKFTDFGATRISLDTLTLYGLTLSHVDHHIWMQGGDPADRFKLSKGEYKFLSTLMESYPDHVTHGELASQLWGWRPENADDDKRARDALFNVVKRLRERLAQIDMEHEYIETVRKWGERQGGYKFNKS